MRSSTSLGVGCVFAAVLAPPLGAQPLNESSPAHFYSDTLGVQYQVSRPVLTAYLDPQNNPYCPSSAVFPTLGCAGAIRRFCRDRGFWSGFGHELVNGAGQPNGTVNLSCINKDVVLEEGSLAISTFPRCVSGGLFSVGCRSDIRLYCKQKPGYGGGYGPIDGNPSFVRVGCLKNETILSKKIDDYTTESLLAPCSTPTSGACTAGVSAYCAAQEGYVGGYGPVEFASPVLRLECARDIAVWAANTAKPEDPSLPVDVQVNAVNPLHHNELTPYRSMSFDGKLSARPVNPTPYLRMRAQPPELFNEPFSQVQTTETANIDVGVDLSYTNFHGNLSGLGSFDGGSVAICDPHQSHGGQYPEPSGNQQSVPARVSNPYACDSAGNPSTTPGIGVFDCYDLSIVGVYKVSPADELWVTPVKVRVQNPKSANAAVVGFEALGSATKINATSGLNLEVLEPTISGDGRLLILNNDDIRYSYASTPCDPNGWTVFKPISSMVEDPNLRGRYGVARYPLRDMLDNVIPPGTQVPGAYPWIDRDGDTLMWLQARQSLFYVDQKELDLGNPATIRSRYPILEPSPQNPSQLVVTDPNSLLTFTTQNEIRLINGDPNALEVAQTSDRLGLTLAGLWTHGRMIAPDNRVNNTDLGLSNARYWTLDLYPTPVPQIGDTITTRLNSPENQFNHLPNLRPDTPREVVWLISTTWRTDELAFDDYLNPKALVVSPMNAPISSTTHLYEDGWVPGNTFRHGYGFLNAPQIANFATSVSQAVADQAVTSGSPPPPGSSWNAAVSWKVPSSGRLIGGARIEPVAAGGYSAKGLWLDGVDDRVEYIVPTQTTAAATAMAGSSWFVSISIDPRSLSAERPLLAFPDGTAVSVVSASTLKVSKGASQKTITLSGSLAFSIGKWTTLSFLSYPNGAGAGLAIYVDGYLFSRSTFAQLGTSYFRLQPGVVTLGSKTAGFKGWVDDFKVLGNMPSVEEVCNHARGTLVAASGLSGPLHDLALLFPQSSHTEVTAAGGNDTLYVCERPIPGVSDLDAYECLGKTRRPESNPSASRCQRERILFPQGPLVWNQPRLDTSQNTFCTSCHVSGHATPALQPAALVGNSLTMHADPRRQPLQAPPFLFGFIPAHLLGASPPTSVSAPVTGENLDQYEHP